MTTVEQLRVSEQSWGFCQCGCGEKTKPAQRTDARLGWKRGQPLKYLLGHKRGRPVGYKGTLAARLASFIIRPSDDDGTQCWGWSGATQSNGYGVLSRNSVANRAHRIAYELFVGPIPDGLWVLHRCDNPPCCNPTHLFLGTPSDNAWDKVRKGRDHQTKKTHCPYGHSYDAENTKLVGTSRFCLACKRLSDGKRMRAPR